VKAASTWRRETFVRRPPRQPRIEPIFPAGASLADLHAKNAKVVALWTDYLESLDHNEVGREFLYTAFEGDRFTNTVEEILTQLHGHSWYHRGQIASIV
jgi:uncharacterized damage-inducible protein DinB